MMTHDFDGKKYEEASRHQREWGTKLIRDLNLQGSEHLLDLGCGDGTLTRRIADLVLEGEVVGIDSSQSMFDAAMTKSRDNLQFLLLDINDLDFDERFDVVFSNASLHWIKDHKRMLENVQRSLRKGGHLRFNFAGEGNCRNFFKVIGQAMALKEFVTYFTTFEWPWHMPPVDDYRALVECSELHDIRVWGEHEDRYFPDAETMIRWVDQPNLMPFLGVIPTHQTDTFRTFVVKRMIEETKQDDGTFFETFRRINVSAVK